MSTSPPFLRRVRIRNYKSIAACDVELGNFSVIVGRNGSGKSNFLDALRFVSEALESSLDFAIRSRGGIEDVFRRTSDVPITVGIDLELSLPDQSRAEYGFEIAWLPRGRFRVQRETLRVQATSGRTVGFKTADGNLVHADLVTPVLGGGTETLQHLPKPAFDRLYLVTIAGLEEFRGTHDALKKMCFYNLNPVQMRLPQKADSSLVLRRDGSNLADIAGRLFEESPHLKQRLLEYLAAIVPEVKDIHRSAVDGFDYLGFQMQGEEGRNPVLGANSMSDGTLRVVGHLIAAMQYVGFGNLLSLVAIEEPETALHPAAAAALLDALREASLRTQIVITSHSPDLLDGIHPDSDMLLVAQIRDGKTGISVVDSVGASAIRDHLFSAGELLRMDQLQPSIQSDSATFSPVEAAP